MVVIRSPRPQLVPFRLHRFGKQRHAAGNLLAEHQGWASSYFKHDAMERLAHWQLPDGNNLVYHYLHGELSGIDLNGAELTRHQMVSGLEMRRSQGALTQQYEYDE